MEKSEIQKMVEETVSNAFAKVELASKMKELENLKAENAKLLTKLSDVEASIPAEKVEEITEVVEKAIGDKVDTAIGEALAEVIDRVEELESSVTNKERVAKALSSKSGKKRSPFGKRVKVTKASDCDLEDEANTLIEKLKSAKTKEELEEVKALLTAFVSSSVTKVKTSAEEDTAELEAYRELGTIDEIEAAVEVLETYAEEIGSLNDLSDDTHEDDIEPDDLQFETFASRRKRALASRKERALASRRKRALASRRTTSSSRVQGQPCKKRVATSSLRKGSLLRTQKQAKHAVALARAERIKALTDRVTKLNSLKKQVASNMSGKATVTSSKIGAGELASQMFMRLAHNNK